MSYYTPLILLDYFLGKNSQSTKNGLLYTTPLEKIPLFSITHNFIRLSLKIKSSIN